MLVEPHAIMKGQQLSEVGRAGGYFLLGAAKNSDSGLFSRQREEVENPIWSLF